MYREDNVGDKRLTDEGIKHLGEEEKWSAELTKLRLNENRLTAKAVAFLAKKKWVKLSDLSLSTSSIRKAGTTYAMRESPTYLPSPKSKSSP